MAERKAWDHARPSRQERGYGKAWDKLRLLILKRDKWLCQACMRAGRVAAARTVDHIKAKAKGGTDDPSNLESLCRTCTKVKDAADRGQAYRPKRAIGDDGWPL